MTSVFCTSTRTPTEGSTRDSASTASTEWKKVAPAPPKRSGTSTPMTPRSNSRVSRPGSSAARSSISRTRGRISWEAKSRTESWKSRSSSDSVERAGEAVASGLTDGMLSSRKRTAGMQTSPRARLARWVRPAAVILCLAAVAAVGRAQQGQPAQPQPPAAQAPAGQPAPPVIPGQDAQPVFRGGINFVRVDVIATDNKAQPVLDLKQEEFEVLEDNQAQKVEQFRLIKVDGNPKPGDPPPREIRNRDDEESEAARDDVRIFAILLDDYHVRRSNSISVREPLIRFIQNQLRPNDMVAVMYPLTPVTDVSFTRDHAKIIGAINAFEGRKYDYRPMNQLEENYARYPTDAVERIRNE